MFASNTLLQLISVAGLLSLASGAPSIAARTTTYPVGVVTPGDGLPTLEELGLTNEDLYDPEFLVKRNMISRGPSAAKSLQARFECMNYLPASVGNAQACQNYLASLGTTSCAAPRGGILMCSAATYGEYTAGVYGAPQCHDTDSSYCRDVATAVSSVIDQCSFTWGNTPERVAMGENAAAGNGCLLIEVFGQES